MKVKRFLVLVLFCSFIFSAHAQSIKVKKDNAGVKGENVEGFEVELTGSYSNIHSSFSKFLKPYGKIRGNDPISLTESTLGSGAVYGVVKEKEKDKFSITWIGIRKEDWPEEEQPKVNKELEKMIYDFAV